MAVRHMWHVLRSSCLWYTVSSPLDCLCHLLCPTHTVVAPRAHAYRCSLHDLQLSMVNWIPANKHVIDLITFKCSRSSTAVQLHDCIDRLESFHRLKVLKRQCFDRNHSGSIQQLRGTRMACSNSQTAMRPPLHLYLSIHHPNRYVRVSAMSIMCHLMVLRSSALFKR